MDTVWGGLLIESSMVFHKDRGEADFCFVYCTGWPRSRYTVKSVTFSPADYVGTHTGCTAYLPLGHPARWVTFTELTV